MTQATPYISAGLYESLTHGVTNYFPIEGSTYSGAVPEAETQAIIRSSTTARNGAVYVRSNTTNGSTTVTLRKNGVDTAITMSIGSGVTGWIEDTTHTVSFSAGDLISWKVVAGGSTGSIWVGPGVIQLDTADGDPYIHSAT